MIGWYLVVTSMSESTQQRPGMHISYVQYDIAQIVVALIKMLQRNHSTCVLLYSVTVKQNSNQCIWPMISVYAFTFIWLKIVWFDSTLYSSYLLKKYKVNIQWRLQMVLNIQKFIQKNWILQSCWGKGTVHIRSQKRNFMKCKLLCNQKGRSYFQILTGHFYSNLIRVSSVGWIAIQSSVSVFF